MRTIWPDSVPDATDTPAGKVANNAWPASKLADSQARKTSEELAINQAEKSHEIRIN
jgi:hypothetical protein